MVDGILVVTWLLCCSVVAKKSECRTKVTDEESNCEATGWWITSTDGYVVEDERRCLEGMEQY